MKKFFVSLALLLINAAAMVAQQMPPIPIDKEVRIGKLDNGLTYYIRHNEYPEHVANFYIAQRVGAIQEDDSQRGLAHFLEHMAFNGSEHFKGNGIIEFTRSLGVQFGSDLNAYTSIDQTVYRVCNVPTKRTSALDSCLLILKDWSNGLLLEADEIDKERDVVHNEWRLGESANQRLITRCLPQMYPGSKYGERMPIGLMSVIDSFKPQTLRDYYHKWYRPDNQAIIVVGDIDVDHTEQQIKQLFSGIVVPADAAKVVDEQVPDNNEAIYIFDKDKEMQMSNVIVMMKHDATPPEDKANMDYLVEQYLISAVSSMFNARLNEMTQEESCPFFAAEAEDGQYMLSKTKDAFTLYGVPKEGKELETLATLMREAKRVVEHGFTATEYERAKADYLSALEKQYTNRNKIKNDAYGNDYRDHYLANDPIPSIESLYQTMNQIVPNLPVEVVNMVVPELIHLTDTNLVVMTWAQEKEGKVYPTVDQMKQTVEAVRSETVEGYVDNVKNEPLITQLPKPGKIVKETQNQVLGFKELKLSNGATVILKKTDFKDDEVQMQAFAKGGRCLYGEADYTNLKVFDQIIGLSGLGQFSSNELTKALAGKNCNADPSLGVTLKYVTAHSTPKDIETMLQMVYLYFTNIKKDEKQVQNLLTALEMQLKNKSLSPDAVFSDSLYATLYSHNKRFTQINAEDVKEINYDRILQIAKESFQDAGPFTFVFVGNIDEQTLRPLIEQYVASLPALKKSKAPKIKDVTTFAKGEVRNAFTVKTDSPKATVCEVWTANAPYTLENIVKLDAVAQVLSMIYLKTIREEESAAYSCGAYSNFNLSGAKPLMMLQAYCPMNPDKQEIALRLIKEGIENAAKNMDPDMVTKVKDYMLKQADVNAKNNSHWVNVITRYKDFNLDSETDYKKTVEALTPQSLQTFLKNAILSSGNHVQVVMKPENMPSEQ